MMVCSSWMLRCMLPSPAIQITRFFPFAKHAPIAAGKSYPMDAQPEFVNSRCPFLRLIAWNVHVLAVPSPNTITSVGDITLERTSIKWYELTESVTCRYSGRTLGYRCLRIPHHSLHSSLSGRGFLRSWLA